MLNDISRDGFSFIPWLSAICTAVVFVFREPVFIEIDRRTGEFVKFVRKMRRHFRNLKR